MEEKCFRFFLDHILILGYFGAFDDFRDLVDFDHFYDFLTDFNHHLGAKLQLFSAFFRYVSISVNSCVALFR